MGLRTVAVGEDEKDPLIYICTQKRGKISTGARAHTHTFTIRDLIWNSGDPSRTVKITVYACLKHSVLKDVARIFCREVLYMHADFFGEFFLGL